MLEKECIDQIDVRVLSNNLSTRMAPIVRLDSKRRDIVFIGGFDHAPNIDAVLYFARRSFPRVQARIPEAVFQVDRPRPDRRKSCSSHRRASRFWASYRTSNLSSIRRASRSRRSDSGQASKARSTRACRSAYPRSSPRIAAEGMYLTHGENAMIADDRESFADAVVRLWTSPELWHKLSKNGLKNLAEHFSVEAAAKPIDELLAWAGLSADSRK